MLVARKKWTALDDQKRLVTLPRTSYGVLLTLSGFCSALVMLGFVYWLTVPTGSFAAVTAKINIAHLQEGPAALTGLREIGTTVRYRDVICDIGPSH